MDGERESMLALKPTVFATELLENKAPVVITTKKAHNALNVQQKQQNTNIRTG